MFKSIRSKFIFFAIIIIIVGVIVSNVFIVTQLHENFHKQSRLMLETTLDVLHNGLYNAMMAGKQKNIQGILDELDKNESISHIRIISREGIVKYAANKNEIHKNINSVEPGHINISGIKSRSITSSIGNTIFSASEPLLNETKCQGCHGNSKIIAYLDVDTNLKDAEANFYEGAEKLLIISGAIVTLLIFILYALFNRLINQPLLYFISALNRVKEGNLAIFLPENKKDEFGTLNTHFNSMINKLKSSNEKIQELHTEQLQRADRLATLGELTAEMAHEVNNHSAIIMSRTDYLLLESGTNKNIGNYKDDLNSILHQTELVSKITRNILKHSKKPTKILQKINLCEAIDNCIEILVPVIKKKNVQIIKDFKDDNVIIKFDQLDIEQAVMNLINNALDSMDENGQITISIFKSDDNCPMLKIKDNGSGIEENILDQVFLPFFTTKDPEKGTGLGLYIVKNICDNHSTDIKCESKPGEGTEFTLTFKET